MGKFDFEIGATKGPMSIGESDTLVGFCKVTEDGAHDVAYYAVYSNKMTEEQGKNLAAGMNAMVARVKHAGLKGRKAMHGAQKKLMKGLLAFGDKQLNAKK